MGSQYVALVRNLESKQHIAMMKTSLFFIGLWPAAVCAQEISAIKGQDAEVINALLWEVTTEENDHVSYLFGSMHTNDSLANTFSKSWWTAFDNCNVLAGEVNGTGDLDIQSAIGSAMMKDTVLSDLYTDE